MRTTSVLFLLLFLCTAFKSNAQTTSSTDVFAGKWEISVTGTPNGDVTFLTELVRKDGKLTGELTNPADPSNKRPITKVVEAGDKLSIYFDSSQAGELSIDLDKIDNDNLKGTLYNFPATAKRGK